ncbi:helix-turn-helix domain-containing protein [Niallia sp. NCCP-28]|uniref:helix-turn-helix domain-containing protein n=1 Tax=Niallia sp. NCCP-28 TaxID=2934712 RepID=UPI002086C101|nr:helix-turn-helix domain-containing protein [Niallia sp. NCCP-28]GKU81660.1 HTH-type transcriptional activator Btr [Niallia sp. NCCP-28]
MNNLFVQNNWIDILLDMEKINKSNQRKNDHIITNYFELVFIKEGKGDITIDGQTYIFNKNNIVFIPPEKIYSLAFTENSSADYYRLSFHIYKKEQAKNKASLIDNKTFSYSPIKMLYEENEILPLVEELYAVFTKKDELNLFLHRALLERIFFNLLKYSKPKPQKDTRMAIEETREYIDKYFNTKITVDSLAQKADLSAKYYSEIFKKKYGIGVIEYLTSVRLNKAKELLIKTEKNICTIAKIVGYSDEFYLSRKFKQSVGISPSLYRKKRKFKIASYDFSTTGHLIALNIVPFAAPLHPKWTSSYYQNYSSDIMVHLNAFRKHTNWGENIAKLKAAKPDIIMAADEICEEEKFALKKIAPLFLYSQTKRNWRQQLVEIAAFLKMEKEAADWLKNYDTYAKVSAKELKRRVGNDTFLIVSVYKHSIFLNRSKTMLEVFYGDLKITPPQPEEEIKYDEQIAMDDLIALNPNHLLVNIRQDTETLEYWKEIINMPLWNTLEAVQRNKVYLISSDPWKEYSASAHLRVISYTKTLLAGKST